MARTPITWNNANFTWNEGDIFSNQSSTPFTWDDVALVEEVVKEIQRRGRPPDDDFIHPFFDDEKKNRRLIKLIYRTQGKVLKEEKEIKEIKVTVKDVKILAKKVLGINVKIL